MHAVIDFPTESKRLFFRDPVEVIRAYEVSDVIPCFERIAAAAPAGLWAAGYVSYEAAPAFEPAMRVRTGNRMPLLAFGLYATPTEALPAHRNAQVPFMLPRWTEQTSEARFREALESIHCAIVDGETYQVNYTNRLSAEFLGDSFSYYESLRAAQGAGWHGFIDTEDYAILSVSPELFFMRENDRIVTRPMKGTARRGRWLAEDERMKSALLASPKERAENLMIVDLLRNDVGRIARTGTVDVPELFTAERYETVWQLTSRVEGLLEKDATLVEIFRALFPCGSVTGAPKINTMRWIAELEDTPREVYCGALGVIRPGGDCAFNVPIRTVWIEKESGVATYGVGSGITIDSNAVDELSEFRAKALVLSKPDEPFELLETMRLQGGEILSLSRHLRRLADSARFFGFALDMAQLEHALREAATESPVARRVRVRVRASGEFAIDASLPAPPRYATQDESRELDALERVELAAAAVSSEDPLLFNKTTSRDVYDRARAAAPHAFDVLLWNERDEITEFTFGNVVVELDGVLVTPPRESGLLAGVFRSELLERGAVVERIVYRSELNRSTRVWFVNSLRGWVEVTLQSLSQTSR